MKKILTGDLHIGLNKDNKIFHNVLDGFFDELIDTCSRKNIHKVICAGDIFHNRKTLTQNSLELAKKLINKRKEIQYFFIRGNHDTYYDNIATPNWLRSVFAEHSNVTIIDEGPLILDELCLVPYNYDISSLAWDGYLVGHFAINGFKMNDNIACFGRLNANEFNKFKHVYSGHFHHPASNKNITYLGSPFQHNFNDVGSTRGYYIFEDGNLEFIEFTDSPRFYIINANRIKEHLALFKNNFIKLIFYKDYGIAKNNKIIEIVESKEPASLFVDVSNIDETISLVQNLEDEQEVTPKTNEDLIFEFLDVQEMPEHIKRSVLYKVIRNMLKFQEENSGI